MLFYTFLDFRSLRSGLLDAFFAFPAEGFFETAETAGFAGKGAGFLASTGSGGKGAGSGAAGAGTGASTTIVSTGAINVWCSPNLRRKFFFLGDAIMHTLLYY
jgi:hypothetical protein